MNTKKAMERDQQYIMHTYARAPLVLERGEGAYVWDAAGKRYLDFGSGIGVNALGYCDPDWAKAVGKQAQKLSHCSNLYYSAPCGKLAKKLCQRTGYDKVFFGNSGAEANEGAIKCARKYSHDHYGPDRHVVVTLKNSFHGRTLATLTANGQEVFHQFFGPFNEGFVYTPANDLAAFEATLQTTPGVCAVLMELVQGEGGVIALDPAFVRGVAELCRQRDILLIADEVQTGMGRTGTLLASEHFGLRPDITTLAKGLGGGLPIGAVLTTEAVAACMTPGTHGSTFGGNPIACAGGLVVLDKLDEERLAGVNACAVRLRRGLAQLPGVKGVSGLGLMIGLELEPGLSAGQVLAGCRENGLLVLTAKERLRLLPPLCIGFAEVDAALAALEKALKAAARGPRPVE